MPKADCPFPAVLAVQCTLFAPLHNQARATQPTPHAGWATQMPRSASRTPVARTAFSPTEKDPSHRSCEFQPKLRSQHHLPPRREETYRRHHIVFCTLSFSFVPKGYNHAPLLSTGIQLPRGRGGTMINGEDWQREEGKGGGAASVHQQGNGRRQPARVGLTPADSRVWNRA
uniref:Uncharacterized protein n=1 Tax=Ixodes ricinus TaxID=34613 RepID=A0A6B0UY08_IXORI